MDRVCLSGRNSIRVLGSIVAGRTFIIGYHGTSVARVSTWLTDLAFTLAACPVVVTTRHPHTLHPTHNTADAPRRIR